MSDTPISVKYEDQDKPVDSVKYLPNGKVMKVQKTRQRKILSCIYCHSKKIKCSRVQPVCNNCDKLGLTCLYFANERVSRGGKKSSSSSEAKVLPDDEGPIQSSVSGSESSSSPDSLAERKELDNSQFVTSQQQLQRVDIAASDKGSAVSSSIISNASVTSVTPDSSGGGGGGSSSVGDSGGYLQNSINGNTVHSVLQTPVVNTASNNITNNFFNTNYSNPQTTHTPQEADPYNFGISNFGFSADLPVVNTNPQGSNQNTNVNTNVNTPNFQGFNFVDHQAISISNPNHSNSSNQQTQLVQGGLSNGGENLFSTAISKPPRQPNNPGLHNSLNAYPSNPETTINYLYGTNTNYNNEQLHEELVKHLPANKERSYELIDRYVNSVHILLPIMCDKINDFVIEHDNFWNYREKRITHQMAVLQILTYFNFIPYISQFSMPQPYQNLKSMIIYY